MISLGSTGSAQDTGGAFALIALVSDPAGAKARLEELVAQAQANEKSLANAMEAQKKADADRVEADALLRQANDLVAAAQSAAADLAKKISDSAALDYSLSEREAAVAASELESKNSIRDRESAMAKLEAQTKALLYKATADADASAEMRAEYEAKLKKLKELAI
jgi:hypothetical protein